jgi:hypothetical protein
MPAFWQIEQLHVMVCDRSLSTSKRTAPQWHPPAWVVLGLVLSCESDIFCSEFHISHPAG